MAGACRERVDTAGRGWAGGRDGMMLARRTPCLDRWRDRARKSTGPAWWRGRRGSPRKRRETSTDRRAGAGGNPSEFRLPRICAPTKLAAEVEIGDKELRPRGNEHSEGETTP